MRALLLTLALAFAAVAMPARAQALPGLELGRQYAIIDGGAPYRPQPAGTVEVAEVFAYTCPHCAHFAPMLEHWAPSLPRHARLVFVPMVSGPDDAFARVFFAAEASGNLAALHPRLFNAIHRDGSLPRTASLAQLQGYTAKVGGMKFAPFNAALRDDATLRAKMANARQFALRSDVPGTPALIVAGRYLVLGDSYEGLLANARAVLDALAPKASRPAAKPRS